MADPVEDKVIIPPTVTPASTPSLTEEQISTLVNTKAEEKANEIATSKVEKLKEELAESLSGGKKGGRYGVNGPESWEKLQDDTKEMTLKEAEALIDKRLADERKANEDKIKQTQKQTEDSQRAEYARMSAEWQEAVADGILPDISKEVKGKLKSGVKYEDLTEQEQKDPGLKAYNEVRLFHIQQRNEGKTTSFYRTATQYRKQPAGTRAPVMGGSVASPGQSDEEYDYAEIQKNRKAKFNF